MIVLLYLCRVLRGGIFATRLFPFISVLLAGLGHLFTGPRLLDWLGRGRVHMFYIAGLIVQGDVGFGKRGLLTWMDRMDRMGFAVAPVLGIVPNVCVEVEYSHGDDCWWVVDTRAWVPAFAGMTEGAGAWVPAFAGMTECFYVRVRGWARGDCGLVAGGWWAGRAGMTGGAGGGAP